MSPSESAILAYWSEHRDQLRQSESQRAVLTNYVLVITSALCGLVAQQKFGTNTLPLSILVVLIGLYGAVTAAKYHERAAYHLTQARALTSILKEIGALGDDASLDEARASHNARYPRLHRLGLHKLWTGLHFGIALLGATLIAITLTR